MTNLEIIKSTYEGENSEENGKNLARYVSEDISWTEANGFPYAGTFIGMKEVEKNVFSRLVEKPVKLTSVFRSKLTTLFQFKLTTFYLG